jgi:hypothetical protein
MVARMRLDLEIDDELPTEASRAAEQDGTTVSALVADGLQRVLDERRQRKPFKLRDGSIRGGGLKPEFAGANWDKIRDASYEDHGA